MTDVKSGTCDGEKTHGERGNIENFGRMKSFSSSGKIPIALAISKQLGAIIKHDDGTGGSWINKKRDILAHVLGRAGVVTSGRSI